MLYSSLHTHFTQFFSLQGSLRQGFSALLLLSIRWVAHSLTSTPISEKSSVFMMQDEGQNLHITTIGFSHSSTVCSIPCAVILCLENTPIFLKCGSRRFLQSCFSNLCTWYFSDAMAHIWNTLPFSGKIFIETIFFCQGGFFEVSGQPSAWPPHVEFKSFVSS